MASVLCNPYFDVKGEAHVDVAHHARPRALFVPPALSLDNDEF